MSTVTHELRTPLTSIRAFSEILVDNPELDVDRRGKFASIILKESERLTRLINNVLDLSKIESGKMEWNLEEIDLREIVNEALGTTAQLIEEKQIRLNIDYPRRMPLVVVDRDRIIQVMLNLLSNAIKFCDHDAGRIMIHLQNKVDKVQVSVSDNGPGISPENLGIIFEKFRQVGNTMTDKPQGTGLGLPICHQIITHFEGELWAESEVGQGATFHFTLPLESVSETVGTNGHKPALNNEVSPKEEG